MGSRSLAGFLGTRFSGAGRLSNYYYLYLLEALNRRSAVVECLTSDRLGAGGERELLIHFSATLGKESANP